MKRKIDYVKVRTLYDEGLGVSEIGRRLGTPKETISKILKTVNCEVTRHVVSSAPKYLKQTDKELERLEDLYSRGRTFSTGWSLINTPFEQTILKRHS